VSPATLWLIQNPDGPRPAAGIRNRILSRDSGKHQRLHVEFVPIRAFPALDLDMGPIDAFDKRSFTVFAGAKSRLVINLMINRQAPNANRFIMWREAVSPLLVGDMHEN
jgi:hypothetical protein